MAIGSLLKPITVGRAPPRSWPSPLKSIPLFRRSNPAFPLRTIPSPRPLTIAPLSALKPSPIRRLTDDFGSNDEKKPFPSRIAALVVLFLVFNAGRIILGVQASSSYITSHLVVCSESLGKIDLGTRPRDPKPRVSGRYSDFLVYYRIHERSSENQSLQNSETALALLRHPDCWFSAYASVHAELSRVDAEEKRWFEELDKLEKFSQMTLLNLNKTSKRSFIFRKKMTKTTKESPNYLNNGYIVVTIMLAVDPKYKLPAINGREDLKKALQRLVSVPSDETMAVEVLWTPQNEKDTPLERDLCEDFPLLNPL